MNQLIRFLTLSLFSMILIAGSKLAWTAEPKVQVLSPKEGSRITQEQSTILVSGKVASQAARSANVDIFYVIDISGSTGAGIMGAPSNDVPPRYTERQRMLSELRSQTNQLENQRQSLIDEMRQKGFDTGSLFLE